MKAIHLTPISRREFVEAAAIAGAGLAALSMSVEALAGPPQRRGVENASNNKRTEDNAMSAENGLSDEIVKAKIRRALLSGPDSITREATVAEMDAQGCASMRGFRRAGCERFAGMPKNTCNRRQSPVI